MRSTGSGLASSTAVSSSARAPMPAASSWATSSWAALAAAVGCRRRRLARRHIGGWLLPARRMSCQRCRMVGAQARDPPRRVLPMGDLVGLRLGPQLLAAAQEIAQHAIHQRLETAAGNARGGAHRLVNRGVGVFGPRFQAHQGHQQQAAHRRLGQRSFEQAAQQKVAAAMGSQGGVSEVHARRADVAEQPGAGQHGVEVAAGNDGRNQSAGSMQDFREGGQQGHRRRITAGPGRRGPL
jgi:hypothetical protein